MNYDVPMRVPAAPARIPPAGITDPNSVYRVSAAALPAPPVTGALRARWAAQLGRSRLENVFQRGEVGLHLTLDGPLDERLGELEEAARLTIHDDVDTGPRALGAGRVRWTWNCTGPDVDSMANFRGGSYSSNLTVDSMRRPRNLRTMAPVAPGSHIRPSTRASSALVCHSGTFETSVA